MRIEVPGRGAVSAVLAGDAGAPAAVVLAHGAGQGMESAFLRWFHQALAERGFFSLRFNFLYMESRRRVPDPRPILEACYGAVADFARAQAPGARLVLGGKSMGGRIASHLVASGYAADGLLFLGYPLHPPGRPEQMRDQHLYGIGCPMLFLAGTRDNFATPELLDGVLERLGPRATLKWIEGGDHSFHVRGRKDEEVYAEMLREIEAVVLR